MRQELNGRCPLLALSPTLLVAMHMSASDPKRTSAPLLDAITSRWKAFAPGFERRKRHRAETGERPRAGLLSIFHQKLLGLLVVSNSHKPTRDEVPTRSGPTASTCHSRHPTMVRHRQKKLARDGAQTCRDGNCRGSERLRSNGRRSRCQREERRQQHGCLNRGHPSARRTSRHPCDRRRARRRRRGRALTPTRAIAKSPRRIEVYACKPPVCCLKYSTPQPSRSCAGITRS